MKPQVGDVWRFTKHTLWGGDVEILAQDGEVCWVKFVRGHESWPSCMFSDAKGAFLVSRDGEPQGPEAKRFEIERHGRLYPHVHIGGGRHSEGNCHFLKDLAAQDRIRGYVYVNARGEEEVFPLPFMFATREGGIASFYRADQKRERIRPIAVLVEVNA